MTDKGYQIATKLVRGGQNRSENRETSEALYMTSGFVYDSAEQAAAAFRDEIDTFVYSRYGNPTVKMFEQRLALLEGAEACRATGTGMAAVFGALACQPYPIIRKLIMRRCWSRQLRFSKKRMPPVSSVNLIVSL